jgi:hypothetical protein
MGLFFGLSCRRLVGVPDCDQFGHSVFLSFGWQLPRRMP